MKFIQITPAQGSRLYAAMVKKEAEIRKQRVGAFSRVGSKQAGKARWKHIRFKGSIRLEQDRLGGVKARLSSADWQLLSAFVGWVDRHFEDQVQSMSILYK